MMLLSNLESVCRWYCVSGMSPAAVFIVCRRHRHIIVDDHEQCKTDDFNLWVPYFGGKKITDGQTVRRPFWNKKIDPNKIGELNLVMTAIISLNRGIRRYIVRQYRSMGSHRHFCPKLGISKIRFVRFSSRQIRGPTN